MSEPTDREREAHAAAIARMLTDHGERFVKFWQPCLLQEMYCSIVLRFVQEIENAGGISPRLLNHVRLSTRRMRDEQIAMMIKLGDLDPAIVAEEIGRHIATLEAIKAKA